MAPVDPVVKLFMSATSELSSLIDRYEAKPNCSGLTPLAHFLLFYHIWRMRRKLTKIFVNKNYFSAPMARICNLLPAISSLFTEREDLIKDIDKYQKKLHKFEGAERTGENLAKMAKHQGQLDTLVARLKAVDVLINQDLKELTLRTEIFLCRILKAHLNWEYQSSVVSVEVNTKLAELFCDASRTGSLATLETEMNNQLAELRKLPLTRRG
ncbi:hypothetical protein PHET_10714 [Paragonimus heterotremus]|uniref:Uncharacterized protein n=1 Tax=Paragonimus heterotremus TaxID=100268 RepID=A0A8J4SZB8_9TREM|nr:hypothetical protein PHET_10714 [Paragonimus heterotremus]